MSKSIFLLLFLCSCFASSAQGEYLNWEKMKLRGKVKSVTESYSYPPSSYKLKEGKVFLPNQTGIFTDIFNNKGNRIKSTLTRDNLSWVNVFRYDDKENLIEDFETDAGGDFYLKIFLSYDSKRNLIGKKECHNYGKDCGLFQYIYDDENNLIEERDYWKEGSLSWRRLYQYDSNRNKIEELVYTGDDELRHKYRYQYDKKGNVTLKMDFFEDTIHWRSTQYLYDENKNLIETNIYNMPGNKLKDKIKFNYDKSGNVTEETRYSSDGSVMNKVTYELMYDETGNWEKKVEIRNGSLFCTTKRQIVYF